MARLLQPSFTGGELSPRLYGRVDTARYAVSLRTCRNFIVQAYGGVTNRPGTQFVCEAKDSAKAVRLLPFVVSTSAAYVMEVGDGYVRFCANGAQVDYPPGTPSEIVTPWTEADLFALRYTQSADVMTVVHNNYQPRDVKRLTSTTFESADFANRNGPFTETNSESSKTVRASAAIGTTTITASAAIFSSSLVGSLLYIEARDTRAIPPWEASKALSIFGGTYAGNVLGLMRRSDGKIYRCATSATPSGAGKEIRTGTVRPTHESGIESDGDGNSTGAAVDRAGVDWEFRNAGYGVVRLASYTNSTTMTGQVIARLPDSVVGGVGTTLNTWNLTGDGTATSFAIAGATMTEDFLYEVTVGGVLINSGEPASGSFGYIVNADTDTIYITPAVGNGVAIVVVEISNANDFRTDKWALSAWSDAQGYPADVEYYGDRLIFAATKQQPQTVWMSRIGAYTDFGHATPVADDDSVTFTINARKLNAVRDLVSLDALLLLTSGGEWRVTAGTNDVLTPSTVGFKAQSYWGADSLGALVIGQSAVYLQDRGYSLRDLAYQFESDGYSGNNLSIFSDHLLKLHRIVDFAYQATPFSCVWLVRDDGVLLSLTYVREQDVVGWARHDTDGFVESVAVIPEGNEDRVYLIVRREIDGQQKRYIERMASRDFDDQADAFFVDCGLTYDGRYDPATGPYVQVTGGTSWTEDEDLTLTANVGLFTTGPSQVGDWIVFNGQGDAPRVRFKIVSVTDVNHAVARCIGTVPVWLRGTPSIVPYAFAHDTFSGLDHLEGKTVSILADGNVHAQRVVTGGSVTLQFPASVAHIGLPYVSDVETLDINVQNQESVRDKQKTVNRVTLLVDESRGIFAGNDADHLTEFKQRTDEGYLDPTSPLSGIAKIYINSSWSDGGRVFVRQRDPLPLTIIGAIPNYSFGE